MGCCFMCENYLILNPGNTLEQKMTLIPGAVGYCCVKIGFLKIYEVDLNNIHIMQSLLDKINACLSQNISLLINACKLHLYFPKICVATGFCVLENIRFWFSYAVIKA